MNEWNVFFRAFHNYKKKTSEEKNIKRFCEFIANAPTDEDNLETIRTYCIIEEDWIKIIEEGMVYVEKAIREERQFIRKQGEVVPIEKLKHVSTDTVTHLARHSELITREPEEDETLTPEKLYMAENLSDYAVYENRFIYMLLCYTRDFINVRLDKIIEFGRTFKMKGKMVKRVKIGKKQMSYVTDMTFEDKNDPLSESFSSSNDLIERIESMQRLTVSLLATPLMREVSKTPMIKPPITRTNVLRMNNNFKNALEMYCKLAEYSKDGYTIEKIKSSIRPFHDAMLSEQVELVALQQFLYYKYGNKLSEKLWQDYLIEEEKSKEQEKQTLKIQAERLKKRIKESGKGYEEYIAILEKQVVDLDGTINELKLAKTKIDNLSEMVEDLQRNCDAEKQKVYDLRVCVQEREKELTQTISKYEDEKIEMQEIHAQNVAEIERVNAEKYHDLEERCTSELMQEKQLHEHDCSVLNEQLENEKNTKTLLKAELHGLRNKKGLISDEEDFTSKEKFNELEEEFLALENLLKTKWKVTKKQIRQDVLGKKPNTK